MGFTNTPHLQLFPRRTFQSIFLYHSRICEKKKMISTEIVCVLALVIVATAKPRAERDAGSALIELIQRQAEGNSTTSVPGLLDYLKNFLEEFQAEIKSLKKKLRASKK